MSDRLQSLKPLYAQALAEVDQLILAKMSGKAPLIGHLAGHIIASGGKRLRPTLTLLSAMACGYRDGSRHVSLAAAVEFIHTATLLHDDVVDESALRRGEATANEVWGNAPSVLVGDFLLSRAFQLMVSDGSMDVLRILSDTSAIISEGEILQLSAQHDPTIAQETYIEIISAKTAALFSAACEVGGIVSGAESSTQKALAEYGLHLGIAFQIVDDALDYSAKQESLGKTIGDDFREGKITLPVLLAFEAGDAEEHAFWKRALSEADQQPDDLEHAMALISKHNTLAASAAEARRYAQQAKQALEVLPENDYTQALATLADFAVEREF